MKKLALLGMMALTLAAAPVTAQASDNSCVRWETIVWNGNGTSYWVQLFAD